MELITEKTINERGALYFIIGYLTGMYIISDDNHYKNEIFNILKRIKIQYNIDTESVNNLLDRHESNKL